MKSPGFLILVLLGFLVSLTGCVTTVLKVKNQTDSNIQLYTGHTRKTFHISEGATVRVPHTAGAVTITTAKGEVWEYNNIAVPDFTNEAAQGFKQLTLTLIVEPSGVITLPSGRKMDPLETMTK